MTASPDSMAEYVFKESVRLTNREAFPKNFSQNPGLIDYISIKIIQPIYCNEFLWC